MTFTGGGNLWGAGMGEAFKTETRKVGWLIPVCFSLYRIDGFGRKADLTGRDAVHSR